MTRRAILSVYDKTGLVELGHLLTDAGFELVASGGTARQLSEAGLAVSSVASVTRSPEILGGRVKTLHPAIHGGILSRQTPEHAAELTAHGMRAVDLVVCNLYPFVETVRANPTAELSCVEQIDIGGVTLLRAAAKNFERVTVVCDPADYTEVAARLARGGDSLAQRRKLALKAFRHTAAYDAAIASWLGAGVDDSALPETLLLVAERDQVLRYGENPHQQAASYRWQQTRPQFEQLNGKALSYNNLVDLDAAWAMPAEFSEPAVAIVKHTNPCGLAVGASAVEAYQAALACDPVSAFGSIITVNRTVDLPFVKALRGLFVEVLAAPEFTEPALEALRRRKRLRVMRALQPDPRPNPLDPGSLRLRGIPGGLLIQTPDHRGVDRDGWTIATERAPTDAEVRELAFAWLACKHVKSNAIVLTRDRATVGIGAGQMNRVQSVRIAARQAGDKAQGAVLASDAFFPFSDGLEAAAAAGVSACIQPGGSIRDAEVIEAANNSGMAMVFTGHRHFRH